MTSPSWVEQQRVEKIVQALLREALTTAHGRGPTPAELDTAVQQETARLVQDFGPQFVTHLIRELPQAEASSTFAATIWRARLDRAGGQNLDTVRASVAHYLFTHRAKYTALTFAGHRHRLEAFVVGHAARSPAAIAPQEIVEHLTQWPSAATRRAHWTTLNGYFGWLLERRETAQNPVPLACSRPRGTHRPSIIFTPEQTAAVLRLTKDTDQIGFWVLALFAGLRTREIRRLQRNPNVWVIIQLRRGVIDLRSDPHRSARRVVPLLPVLHAWLSYVKKSGLPLFPVRHWQKTRTVYTQVLALSPRQPMPSHGIARRSFIAYRMARGDLSLAQLADLVGSRERHLERMFTARAEKPPAETFFNFTPETLASAAPTLPPPPRPPEAWLMEHCTALARLVHLPGSYGAVFGMLLWSPSGLSFTELADRLDASAGSISQALKGLTALGAIEAERDPPKLRFRPCSNLESLWTVVFQRNFLPTLKPWLAETPNSDAEPAAGEFARQIRAAVNAARLAYKEQPVGHHDAFSLVSP